MSILFKRTPGIIYDLYHSLFNIYNNDFFISLLQKYDIKMNKDAEKGIRYLSKKVDKDMPFMRVLFDKDTPVDTLIEDEKLFWSFSGINDYVDYLKGLNEDNIKNVLINSINGLKKSPKAYEILENSQSIIGFLENMDIDDGLKWSLLNFLSHPLEMVSEFISFLESYIPHLNHVLEKNNKTIESFDLYIEDKLKNEGTDFLKGTPSFFYDTCEFEDKEEIYVTSLFFNFPSCMYIESKNNMYFLIGFEFEKAMEHISGQTDLDKNINIFKNLSDKTRFKILELIKDESLFGQEIAKKVGISTPTVWYHMDYLIASGMVFVERKGRKTYYKLNNDSFKKAIEFLTKTFEI